jgi:hypothetical protein
MGQITPQFDNICQKYEGNSQLIPRLIKILFHCSITSPYSMTNLDENGMNG